MASFKEMMSGPIPRLSVGTCVHCKEPVYGVHSDDVRMHEDGPVHEDCHDARTDAAVNACAPHGPRRGRHGSAGLS